MAAANLSHHVLVEVADIEVGPQHDVLISSVQICLNVVKAGAIVHRPTRRNAESTTLSLAGGSEMLLK